MKSLKSIFAVTLIALVAVACGKVEKILPKKDGLWKTSSVHVISYLNGTLTGDTTLTDSLPTTYFDKDGTGWQEEIGSTTKSTFNWSVNDDNDLLTLISTDSIPDTTYLDILESSKDQMTLYSDDTYGATPFLFRYETTTIIDRIK